MVYKILSSQYMLRQLHMLFLYTGTAEIFWYVFPPVSEICEFLITKPSINTAFLEDYVCGLVPGRAASPLCLSVNALWETLEPGSQDISQFAEKTRRLMKTEAR